MFKLKQLVWKLDEVPAPREQGSARFPRTTPSPRRVGMGFCSANPSGWLRTAAVLSCPVSFEREYRPDSTQPDPSSRTGTRQSHGVEWSTPNCYLRRFSGRAPQLRVDASRSLP